MLEDKHLEQHLQIDQQALKVQALQTRAGLALDVLNFCQAFDARNKEQDLTFTIPREDELKQGAVSTLINYFGPVE